MYIFLYLIEYKAGLHFPAILLSIRIRLIQIKMLEKVLIDLLFSVRYFLLI